MFLARKASRPARSAVVYATNVNRSTLHLTLQRAFASQAKIVYTYTDEAPMLATYSLLPIIRKFTDPAGIQVDLSDISVAARAI
eukprot:SAG11_NODE_25971_length_351_cov_1.015873_1_plen_83_part_10